MMLYVLLSFLVRERPSSNACKITEKFDPETGITNAFLSKESE